MTIEELAKKWSISTVVASGLLRDASAAGVLPGVMCNKCYPFSCSCGAAPQEPAQHPDDIAVDKFAAAMKDKLADARAKGRSGWEQCDPVELSVMLREHVEKGDPRDVANFCMMLWHHEAPISKMGLAQADEQVAEPIGHLLPCVPHLTQKVIDGKRYIFSGATDMSRHPDMASIPLYTRPADSAKPFAWVCGDDDCLQLEKHRECLPNTRNVRALYLHPADSASSRQAGYLEGLEAAAYEVQNLVIDGWTMGKVVGTIRALKAEVSK